MSEDAADETVIAAAIFAVDEALPFDPYATKIDSGGRLVLRCARNLNLDEEEAFDALGAYKQFMVLKAVCKDFDATKLSPPPPSVMFASCCSRSAYFSPFSSLYLL